MTTKYANRYTRKQWEGIISLWKCSAISATEFCNQYGLGIQSFYKWRRMLKSPPNKYVKDVNIKYELSKLGVNEAPQEITTTRSGAKLSKVETEILNFIRGLDNEILEVLAKTKDGKKITILRA